MHSDSGTRGPIRPTQKKPPTPTGHLCCYGICCHFGTACVNSHTSEELEFFTQRESLRLQLRELQMQVEAKKIEFKRKQMSSREPLKPLNSLPQVPQVVSKDATSTSQAKAPSDTSKNNAPKSVDSKAASKSAVPKSSARKSASKSVSFTSNTADSSSRVKSAVKPAKAAKQTSMHTTVAMARRSSRFPHKIRALPYEGKTGVGHRNTPDHLDFVDKHSFEHSVLSGHVVHCSDVVYGYDDEKFVQLENGAYVPLFISENEPLFEWLKDDVT